MIKKLIKKRAVSFICIVLLLSNSITVQAQTSLPVFVTSASKTIDVEKKTNELLQKKFKAYEVAAFPVEELGKFLKANNDIESEFQLKLTDKVYEIKLQSSKIIAANYKLTIQEPTGMRTIQQAPDNIFYKGFANNDKKNIVRLTLKEGLVSGYIQQEGKEVFIESLSNYIPTAATNDVIIYNTDDAITTENFTCGVSERANMLERAETQHKQEAGVDALTGVCKKLKFVFITDYSMYQYFNGDIAAMQNKMLAVLNNTQGVYTGLNFNSNPIDDVGADELQFEMIQFHVVTCSKCDITSEGKPPLFYEETVKVLNWINKYLDTTSLKIVYYWTNKLLIDPAQPNVSIGGFVNVGIGAFNCNNYKVASLVCSYKEDQNYLKIVSAHELGHVLGCIHDNLISPTVTSFIMNPSVNVNATSLSSIADFNGQTYNGFLYSSKAAVKRKIAELTNCISSCDSISTCEDVLGLSVSQNIITDSAVFTWQGNANSYNVKIRENSTDNSSVLINQNVNENRFVTRSLAKCKYYTLEVSNNCGKKSSITFSNSVFKSNKPVVIHERSSLHDVEVTLTGSNIYLGFMKVNVDHVQKWNAAISYPGKVLLKDIFSDGATHRIDIYADNNNFCKQTIFYKAPYYRKDATVFVNEDFSGCTKPTNWKDSIWRKPANTLITYTPFWNYDSTTKDRVRTIQAGSIDSTCMLYFYNSSVPPKGTSIGSIDMTTPAISVNNYENIYLSFDYKYILRAYSIRQPYFKVQCYDGQNWNTIYDAPTTINNRTGDSTNFWDTIPARKFIPLDAFANANLKVRFLVEDSSFVAPGQFRLNTIFIALDNVRIDGYLKKGMKQNQEIKIFPNPVNDELFIRYDAQLQQPKRYKIIDIQGKLVRASTLNNYRINVANLATAIYFIQFYFDDNTTSDTYKFYKF